MSWHFISYTCQANEHYVVTFSTHSARYFFRVPFLRTNNSSIMIWGHGCFGNQNFSVLNCLIGDFSSLKYRMEKFSLWCPFFKSFEMMYLKMMRYEIWRLRTSTTSHSTEILGVVCSIFCGFFMISKVWSEKSVVQTRCFKYSFPNTDCTGAIVLW